MLVLLAILIMAGAFAQTPDANDTGQKPTEEKQGGEYSGLENTGNQSYGIPRSGANPTPQAPITGLDVQTENKTTSTASAPATTETQNPLGIAMIAGMGGAAAVAIGSGVWYFRKSRSK